MDDRVKAARRAATIISMMAETLECERSLVKELGGLSKEQRHAILEFVDEMISSPEHPICPIVGRAASIGLAKAFEKLFLTESQT